ncbi:hypothetical protein V5O48_007311, partial [Marasmius crinis-equi]
VWDPPGGAIEEGKIDVPWPMDAHEHERISASGPRAGQSTITRFLSGGTSSSRQEHRSMTEMYSKACVLFSRATSLANASSENMNTSARQQLLAARNHVDGLIDNFAGQLPPAPSSIGASVSEVHMGMLIHTLTYASIIQLANINPDARSSIKSIAAARGAIRLVPGPQASIISPVFGILWEIIGRVIIDDIRRLRQSRVGRNQLKAAEETIGRLGGTMEGFTRSTFIHYQMGKLREALGMDTLHA